MQLDAIESYEYEPSDFQADDPTLTIELRYDEDPLDPRVEWDNLGTIVHWHRDYDFGENVRDTLDRINAKSADEMFRKFERYLSLACDAAIILPISMIDHSGVSIWVASRRNEESIADPGGWDSGQVGYIYCTREQIRTEYEAFGQSHEDAMKNAEACLRGEVQVFDDYLTGSVCYWCVCDEDGDVIESCGGYYGTDGLEQAKAEAEDTADSILARLRDERAAEAANREYAAKLGIPTMDA